MKKLKEDSGQSPSSDGGGPLIDEFDTRICGSWLYRWPIK